jgi:RNA polymerase sigma-70 factor (ECF subfamily)
MNARRRPDNEDAQDLEALALVRSGGQDAFAQIVTRYTPVLYSFAYRFLGADSEAAEEAVQEIFLKVYASLSSFDAKRRFFPWLYTMP